MKKERKEDSFIKQPFYKGGDKALEKFIQEHLLYPEKSRLNKIEGDVHIRYDINHKGDVIDTKIIGGLDDLCNEEAIRVVKLLKFIVPKTPRNLKVTFHKTLRIHFKLNEVQQISYQTAENKQPPVAGAMQISYSIVSDATKSTPAPEKTAVTYSYMVKMNEN